MQGKKIFFKFIINTLRKVTEDGLFIKQEQDAIRKFRGKKYTQILYVCVYKFLKLNYSIVDLETKVKKIFSQKKRGKTEKK